MPKVSIVLRLKNEQRFLPKVLEALSEQTFRDFEVVAVDSGSTDRTIAILNNFKSRLEISIYRIPPEDFTYSRISRLLSRSYFFKDTSP